VTEVESAFALLAEPVQRQLYRMGWRELRQIQVDAIRAYLGSEEDALLITAETAAGKTEAAFLPVLSKAAAARPGSVRALYIGPLKALINDQMRRVEELCGYLELPVHRWHGDVAQSQKAALVAAPDGVVLITPESLESLLINRTRQLGTLFSRLQAVVIDELHAFLGSERGLHLASLLVRLRRYHEQPSRGFRMLGLSATIGDVEVARRFLMPDAPERVKVIKQGSSEGKVVQLRLHAYEVSKEQDATETDEEDEDDSEAFSMRRSAMGRLSADLVAHCDRKSALVFVNSKADLEMYADLCNEHCKQSGLPENFLVHHGSLAREHREDTEARMKGTPGLTTFCSSTLEMGIDIGNVSMVGQIGAPFSVASLKQRMGRSGRRDGEPRRLRMYVLVPKLEPNSSALERLPVELLRAVASVELMLSGWVEPPTPASTDLSTLVHQVISSIAECASLSALELYQRLCIEGPFRQIEKSLFSRVLRCLGAKDVVEQSPSGGLILGLEGERIRASKEFYAAFLGKVEVAVLYQGNKVGTLPIDILPQPGEFLMLAGKRWSVVEADFAHSAVQVVPARRRRRAKFAGSVADIHYRVHERMREILEEDSMPVYLASEAQRMLVEARKLAREAGLGQRRLVKVGEGSTLVLPWCGSKAQRTLATAFKMQGWTVIEHSVGLEVTAELSDVRSALRSLADRTLASEALAEHIQPKACRKFDELLDDELLDVGIAHDGLDYGSACEVARMLLIHPLYL